MANVRQRFVFGGLVALFGALLFEVASSYVIDHGYNKWAALIVGLFAFPAAPATWQLIAEHKRKKRQAAAKKPSTSTLTGYDRYWLRFVAVALIVIGPMAAASRFKVIGAVIRHGLWFVPEHHDALGAGAARDFKDQEQLLARVPGEAELVIVFQAHKDDGGSAGSMVFAWGGGKAAIIADRAMADADATAKLDELNKDRDKLPWLPIEKLVVVSDKDPIVFASESWKTKVEPGPGPSADLRKELARAPQKAPFVAGWVSNKPATRDGRGAVWATMDDKGITLEGRAEQKDPAAAKKLVDDLGTLLHGQTKDLPASCKDDVAKIADAMKLDTSGSVVTGRVQIAKDQLLGLMFCALK